MKFPFWRSSKPAPQPQQAAPAAKPSRAFSFGAIAPVGVGETDYRLLHTATGSNRMVALAAVRRIAVRSTLCQSYLKIMRTNVVGLHGPAPAFVNVSSDSDRMQLEQLWKRWSRDPTAGGRMDWSSLMRALVGSYAIDGRVFVVMRNHRDYEAMTGLLAVPREWLVDEYGSSEKTFSTFNAGKQTALHGIVRRSSGRTAGYLMYGEVKERDIASDNSGYLYRRSISEMYFPESMVCDFMSAQSANDIDGNISHIVSVLDMLGRISRLDDSMIIAMQTSAKKMGFITRDESSENTDDSKDYVAPVEFEGSHIESLPVGYGFASFDPHAPNGDIAQYRSMLLKNAAAGLAVDHATLGGDLREVNYSSIRHGAITAQDYYRTVQADLEYGVCRPALEFLLDTARMAGELKISDDSYEQALECEWRHRSWAWVDPAKDAEANKSLIRLGVSSPQAVCMSLGIDYRQVVSQLAEAKQMLDAAGLTAEDIVALAGTADAAVARAAEPMPAEVG